MCPSAFTPWDSVQYGRPSQQSCVAVNPNLFSAHASGDISILWRHFHPLETYVTAEFEFPYLMIVVREWGKGPPSLAFLQCSSIDLGSILYMNSALFSAVSTEKPFGFFGGQGGLVSSFSLQQCSKQE